MTNLNSHLTGSIVERLEASNYLANEQQVEALAHECYSGQARVGRADTTYLKVLVAGCQSALGQHRGKRVSGPKVTDIQLNTIGSVHDTYYMAVMRGITTQDIIHDDNLPADERQSRALERNRRSAFARTAKSTLVGFVRAGYDLRDLVVSTITKSQLREAAQIARHPPHMQHQSAVVTAYDKLASALARTAHEDPGGTRETIKHIISELEKLADSTSDDSGTDARNRRAVREHGRAPTGHGPSPAMIHSGHM